MKNEARNGLITKYLRWIPALALMVVIFVFSAMPGDESADTSMLILRPILNAYHEISHKDITPILVQSLHLLVRKVAHFSEYALLGVLLIWARLSKDEKRIKRLIMAVVISALYACTDEFHQYFVPGRYASPADVLIDSAGALTGAVIFLLFAEKVKKGRKNHEKV